MPKRSDDATLARSVSPAILDRESYADAYSRKGPESAEALALRDEFQALRGKRLKAMSPSEQNTARLMLLYAEQWEVSLAESNPGKATEAECRRNVAHFREMRHRLWGRSALEASIAEATPVDLSTLHELSRPGLLATQSPGDSSPGKFPVDAAAPASRKDLEERAQQYADQFEAGHPAAGPASRFGWTLEMITIDQITDAPDADWMKAEIDMWAEEGEPDRFQDLLTEEIRSPVVAVAVEGGLFLWDGLHRIGALAMTGRKEIQAMIGRPMVLEPEPPTRRQPRP